MTYSTLTTCTMCSYGTMERSDYYCGKGLKANIHGCSGYQQGIQAKPPRPLPTWDNPYPLHPHERYRAMGCKVLPINRDSLPYTNVVILDRWQDPLVDHSNGLVVGILNIMNTYPKLTKTLLSCKFKSAYGVDYKHCIGKVPAEVSVSVSMLWGVYKVQLYVQVVVFSLLDGDRYSLPYIQNEKNGYTISEEQITGPWWEQRETVRGHPEVTGATRTVVVHSSAAVEPSEALDRREMYALRVLRAHAAYTCDGSPWWTWRGVRTFAGNIIG